MPALTYTKHERISLLNHPELNEKWVQDRIAEEPSILGLGDVILKDRERAQPRAGRLDLLLQDPETLRRFEVEVQLGTTDEAHIVRTLEYWDVERKRYPQYDHTAVLVAEVVTSRFFNVITLFNGFIPIVAIQMNAIRLGEAVSLVFTTVLDQMTLGLVDEDEEIQEVADRAFWEQHATKETVAMADEMLEIIRTFDPEFELKYNKFYIGLARGDRPLNFVVFKPQKNALRLEARLPRSDETEAQLDGAGIDVLGYDERSRMYKIRLARQDPKKHEAFLRQFLESVYRKWAE